MSALEQLMKPVPGEQPAGPDLSYDPERQVIEDAFEAARAAAAGEGEPPDWASVIRSIKGQSEKTKDAWLAVYLARAGARAQQLPTVALGCEYLAGMLETFWDDAHPSLEDYGFQGRKGACDSLASHSDFVIPLRRVVVVEHARLGRFTGEDLERFAREGDQAEGIGMFRAALADTSSDELAETLGQLDSIRSALGRVDSVLTDKAEDTTGTNFSPAYDALDTIRRTLGQLTGMGGGEVVPDLASDSTASASGGDPRPVSATTGSAPSGSGRIESRGDVTRALEAIIDYYGRSEPGSPIPVILTRAKSWVHMDFLAILSDIAPESVKDARRVLTISEDE